MDRDHKVPIIEACGINHRARQAVRQTIPAVIAPAQFALFVDVDGNNTIWTDEGDIVDEATTVKAKSQRSGEEPMTH